jgi:hypothetical protein
MIKGIIGIYTNTITLHNIGGFQMEIYTLFGFIQLFIYVGILGFGTYFLLTTLKLMKEKNNYLKEISEDIKKYTDK